MEVACAINGFRPDQLLFRFLVEAVRVAPLSFVLLFLDGVSWTSGCAEAALTDLSLLRLDSSAFDTGTTESTT